MGHRSVVLQHPPSWGGNWRRFYMRWCRSRRARPGHPVPTFAGLVMRAFTTARAILTIATGCPRLPSDGCRRPLTGRKVKPSRRGNPGPCALRSHLGLLEVRTQLTTGSETGSPMSSGSRRAWRVGTCATAIMAAVLVASSGAGAASTGSGAQGPGLFSGHQWTGAGSGSFPLMPSLPGRPGSRSSPLASINPTA